MSSKMKMTNTKIPIQAIAVFAEKIKGSVTFTEDLKNDQVRIEVQLTGLKKNAQHGFHVHEAGDLTNHCESLCAHFNPYNVRHGGQNSAERHVGDLGNLNTDSNGNVNYVFYDHMIRLRGTKCNIIGRGLIIHADPDDCGVFSGRGDANASLTNGNAGKRIACSIIGYSAANFQHK
jgi:Cu-Zn family superoxide dismutase